MVAPRGGRSDSPHTPGTLRCVFMLTLLFLSGMPPCVSEFLSSALVFVTLPRTFRLVTASCGRLPVSFGTHGYTPGQPVLRSPSGALFGCQA